MSDKIVAIVHENLDQYWTELRDRFPDIMFLPARDPEQLAGLLDQHRPDAAFSCVSGGFARERHRPLMMSSGLSWLQVGGAGFDQFAGWQDYPLTLTNAAGVLSPVLADTMITMLRALCFRMPERIAAQKSRRWAPLPFTTLAGKRLLIVGTGSIARAVAVRAQEEGMTVFGVSKQPRSIDGFDAVIPRSGLDQALGDADFVCLHVPLDHETAHLINAERLGRMKPSAYLLNAARGRVVDQAALIEALRRRQIAGAYLDVFDPEPLPSSSPLWDLDNVIISAHCSDMIEDWELRLARFFMDNLDRWCSGQALENIIQRTQ